MAYMNQDKKAELAPGIKAVLKKYGIKGSISVSNNMSLVVTLKAGKLDFNKNIYETLKDNPYYNMDKQYNYIDVNVYHIDSHYTGKVKAFLNELKSAMMVGNHNNSDIQSDYFDVGWYVNINVGKWNKPYQLEA